MCIESTIKYTHILYYKEAAYKIWYLALALIIKGCRYIIYLKRQ